MMTYNRTITILSIYDSTALFWTLAVFVVFLDLLHSREDSSDGDQPVAGPLPAHRTA
jgi:hypothetical protein